MDINSLLNTIIQLALLVLASLLAWLSPRLVSAIDAWAQRNRQHAWAQGAAEIVRSVAQQFTSASGAQKLGEAEARMVARFGVTLDDTTRRDLLESAYRQMHTVEVAVAKLPTADAGSLQAGVAGQFATLMGAVNMGATSLELQKLVQQFALVDAGRMLAATPTSKDVDVLLR